MLSKALYVNGNHKHPTYHINFCSNTPGFLFEKHFYKKFNIKIFSLKRDDLMGQNRK